MVWRTEGERKSVNVVKEVSDSYLARLDRGLLTCRLVQITQVGEILGRFEQGGISQRWEKVGRRRCRRGREGL